VKAVPQTIAFFVNYCFGGPISVILLLHGRQGTAFQCPGKGLKRAERSPTVENGTICSLPAAAGQQRFATIELRFRARCMTPVLTSRRMMLKPALRRTGNSSGGSFCPKKPWRSDVPRHVCFAGSLWSSCTRPEGHSTGSASMSVASPNPNTASRLLQLRVPLCPPEGPASCKSTAG
jgi:hypothetical protein